MICRSRQKSERLYFLQHFVNMKKGGVVANKDAEMRTIVSSWNSPETIIEFLLFNEVISDVYALPNLQVDLWYLTKTYRKSFLSRSSFPTTLTERNALIFQVVVQMLIDLQLSRPCDVGIWSCDVSPDHCFCRPDLHICGSEALVYLEDMNPEIEEEINLSKGFISKLVQTIKKDSFSMESFF